MKSLFRTTRSVADSPLAIRAASKLVRSMLATGHKLARGESASHLDVRNPPRGSRPYAARAKFVEASLRSHEAFLVIKQEVSAQLGEVDRAD